MKLQTENTLATVDARQGKFICVAPFNHKAIQSVLRKTQKAK